MIFSPISISEAYDRFKKYKAKYYQISFCEELILSGIAEMYDYYSSSIPDLETISTLHGDGYKKQIKESLNSLLSKQLVKVHPISGALSYAFNFYSTHMNDVPFNLNIKGKK